MGRAMSYSLLHKLSMPTLVSKLQVHGLVSFPLTLGPADLELLRPSVLPLSVRCAALSGKCEIIQVITAELLRFASFDRAFTCT